MKYVNQNHWITVKSGLPPHVFYEHLLYGENENDCVGTLQGVYNQSSIDQAHAIMEKYLGYQSPLGPAQIGCESDKGVIPCPSGEPPVRCEFY